MDLTALWDYCVLIIVGICLCVGYAIKGLEVIPNKYIPVIMAILGTLLNIWICSWLVTPEIIFGGMFSGLASTGLYEAFKQLIEGRKDVVEVKEFEDLEDE